MIATEIDATILKTVRKARKLGRSRLAKLSGLTERQIAVLEGGTKSSVQVSPQAITRVSEALNVPVGILTGEMELTESDLVPLANSTCTSGCCG